MIEQLHAKSGLPSLANTIGPSNLQIYRTVAQLYETADIYVGIDVALLLVAVAAASTSGAHAIIHARLAATATAAPLNIPLLLPLPHVPAFWIAIAATVCVAIDVGITLLFVRHRHCWK